MEWREVVARKRDILTKATQIMMSRPKVDVVELSNQLGIDVRTFIIFFSDDLINIAKTKGFTIIYGSYDPETGTVKERVVHDGKSIIVPIFIKK